MNDIREFLRGLYVAGKDEFCKPENMVDQYHYVRIELQDIERAIQEIDTLRSQLGAKIDPPDKDKEIASLRGVLELCGPTNAAGARVYDEFTATRIRHICETRGYGNVMQATAAMWYMKDPIGAFTLGPCVATVRHALGEDIRDPLGLHRGEVSK